MSDFNVQSELLELKSQTQSIRKRSYSARKSRLDKYKFQLLELYKAGATGAELQRCLLYTSPSPRDHQPSRMPSAA